MRNLQSLTSEIISEDSSILEAIAVIQSSPYKMALIVNQLGELKGTVTDGDLRRALLRGLTLDSSVLDALNPNPVVFSDGSFSARGERLLGIRFAPVLDKSGRPVGMCAVDVHQGSFDNAVLLLAGGKGTRLMPYTRDVPKPLVEFAGKPMIEHVITHFKNQGFQKFFISVNHMADQIEGYLKRGESLDVEIEYLHEQEPLGTAGPMGFLVGRLGETLVVSNADIVTNCDFGAMLDFHTSLDAQLTVGLREYSFQVPFGVIEMSGTNVMSVREKPVVKSQVAAGIYCVSPEVVDTIRPNVPLDMPNLITNVIVDRLESVHGFPIHETWRDVGRPEDLEQLRQQVEGKLE